MRRGVYPGAAAIVVLAGLAACNQNTASNNRANPKPQNPQTAATDTAKKNDAVIVARDSTPTEKSGKAGELTASTKSYVQNAAMGDMFEIESSKVALDRSKSPDVKKFAQDMIDAHTKTTDELKAKVAKSGLIIEMPLTPDTMHKGLLDELKNASSDDFDGRYIAQQKNAHNEALMIHKNYANNGDVADLKALASDTLPKIEMHIEMVAQLDNAHRSRTAKAETK